MIKNIIQLLNSDNFYGQSEVIDIAKGKYEYTTTIKGLWKQKIRANKSK